VDGKLRRLQLLQKKILGVQLGDFVLERLEAMMWEGSERI